MSKEKFAVGVSVDFTNSLGKISSAFDDLNSSAMDCAEKVEKFTELAHPFEFTGTILLDPPLPMPQGNNIVTVSFSDRQKKRRRRNLRRNMKRANGTRRKKSQRNEFALIKDYKFLWDGNCKTREENGVLMGSLSMRRLGKL